MTAAFEQAAAAAARRAEATAYGSSIADSFLCTLRAVRRK